MEHLLLLVHVPEYENSTCAWPDARPPKRSKQRRGHKARCKKRYTTGNMESSLVWVRFDPIFHICGEVLVVDCKNAVSGLTKLLLRVRGEFIIVNGGDIRLGCLVRGSCGVCEVDGGFLRNE